MIVIVNGPLGVGKTEVAWKLIEYFDKAMLLDGDYVGAVHPFEIYDEQRIEYLYQTLRHLVAWHAEHGYHNFVIDYVFEQPESLARLRELLADLDDVVYAFRLTCADDELERRVQRRNRDGDVAWELKRFRELSAIQEANSQRGDLGFVIDTTALNVSQVAEAIWRNITEAIVLKPYDPGWPARFEEERQLIAEALGDLALEIYHIGSTAIPGLEAKPVIDILVAVRRLDDAAECIAPLQRLGYTFVDRAQNIDRRFFRKGRPRTHHAHIVEQNSQAFVDHLAFRDALRSDARLRDEYAALKRDLAGRYKHDRATYSDSKTEFVRQVLAER